jgi:hypothetical protein
MIAAVKSRVRKFQKAVEMKLNFFRKPPSPVLVYQMGKVGSKTIEATLRARSIPNPIHHVHFLSWRQIEAVEQYYLEQGLPRRFSESRAARNLLDTASGKKCSCKIITLVRDWVARAVSDLFENMELLLPECAAARHDDGKSPEMILKYLQAACENFDPNTDFAATWFDKELKEVFGFDIFSVDFDKQRGYQIYHSPHADILCIRLEDLSRVYRESFAEFLNISIPSLVHDNTASAKQYHQLYTQIKDRLSVSPEALNKIYQCRLMTHFYTPETLAAFKNKWSPR